MAAAPGSRGARPPTAAKPRRLSAGRQYPDGFVMYDAQARPTIGSRPLPSIPNLSGSTDRRRGPPAPHQTTVQLHPGSAATCTCHTHPRPPPQLSAKVRSIGTGPTRDDDWGPPATMGAAVAAHGPIYGNTELPYASPDDQHHYFVLDPDVVDDDRPPPPSPPPVDVDADAVVPPVTSVVVSPTFVDCDSALRFPTPPPPLLEATLPATVGAAARRQSPDGKERDEGRDGAGAQDVDDELAAAKNHRGRSIHEIPLRPTRDGQTAAAAAVVVVGGPLCDDSGVDMGTSSWP